MNISGMRRGECEGSEIREFGSCIRHISDSVHVWEGNEGSWLGVRSRDKERCHDLRRKILASALNCSEQDIQIAPDSTGRPVILHPKTDLSFSTSYTGSRWVLALSTSGPVGVDIEDIRNDLDFMGISRRFFSDNESRYLADIPPDERAVPFFAFWTLKEAYLKATGTGLAGLMTMPDLSDMIGHFLPHQISSFRFIDGFTAFLDCDGCSCLALIYR